MGTSARSIAVYFTAILLTTWDFSNAAAQQYPEPGSRCQVKEGVHGICKKLKECPEAISNLKADVKPKLCGGIIKGNEAVVCCRSEPRISEKKCQEYEQELANASPEQQATPFLPLEFQETARPKVFECDGKNPLIVGGRDAKLFEFPHQVALGFETPDRTIWGCGGSLISKEFVLTAAHCIDTTQYGRPKFVLGGDLYLESESSESDTSSSPNGRTVVEISDYFVHPNYKRPLVYHDIALVRLANSVNISKALRPACLPVADKRMDKILTLIATGFGKLGYAEPQSNILQAVVLNKFSLTNCNEYYEEQADKKLRYPQNITRKQICAGDEKGMKDSCQGDSGGPLSVFLDDKPCIHYVLGITSFGSSFCGSGAPGVYTNVQSYMDWIEDIVWSSKTELFS